MNQQMIMKIKKLQKEMQDTQAMIEATEFEGSVAGVVSVTILGSKEIKSVVIDKAFSVEDDDDRDMLADSIVAATSQAYEKCAAFTEEHMAKYAMLLNAGGMF